jgi:hypothetical protein
VNDSAKLCAACDGESHRNAHCSAAHENSIAAGSAVH